MNKKVTKVLRGMPASDGAGVNLTRALGQPNLKHLDPFLMLDEIHSDNPNDYIAGFPPHPHKGFETLTYMIQGSMEHNDSTGGHGLIESGGVQYMTAGKGIVHSETPKQESGLLWGFQLWLNLPASKKLVDASYVDINKSMIPEVKLSENVSAKLIAGQVNNDGITGPIVRDDINLHIYDLTSSNSNKATLEFQDESVGYIYVYQGQLSINDKHVTEKHIAVLEQGTDVQLSFANETRALLVMGQPIKEPIVQYGPFVMNSMEEINQAISDYQSGQFV